MILSIDIGGTSIKHCLISEKYEISESGSFLTEKNNYEKLIEKLTFLHEKYNFVEGIAISCPGALDEDGKIIGITAIPCIQNQNIKDSLIKSTGKPVSIINDANASLMSEFIRNDVNDVAAIVIGTGIGGAFTVKGELVKGFSNAAGEFGALLFKGKDNQPNASTLSTGQLVTKYKDYFGDELDGKILFKKYYGGDAKAKEALDEFFCKLVILTFNIEYILNPDTIVFSGAITNEPMFLELFNNQLKKIVFENKDLYRQPAKNIKVSEYRGSANLYGSAFNWFKEKNKYEKN